MTGDQVKTITKAAIAESGVPKVEVVWVDSIGTDQFKIQFMLHRLQSVPHERVIDIHGKSEDSVKAEIISIVKALPGA